jgi:hypothetical protein
MLIMRISRVRASLGVIFNFQAVVFLCEFGSSTILLLLIVFILNEHKED